MIILIIVAAVMVIMGVIVIIGKGDNLIAGYNLASEEERSKYNIKRLRGLIGGVLIVIALMMCMMPREESMTATWSFIGLTMILCIVVVILANTWAKKK